MEARKMTVNFMYNGIKIDGKLYKASYRIGGYCPELGIPESTITMHAASYKKIPRLEGLHIENDSDIMTDYFETDTVRIAENDKYYNEKKKGLILYLQHNIKRLENNIASGNKRYGLQTMVILNEYRRTLSALVA
jgi:hypothetical protein